MTREEFIAFVSAEQEPLRRFLLALCGDPAEADDIAQDALVNAFVASSSFRGGSRFGTWLFRIAYNCFIDRKRSRKWQAEPIDERTESVAGGNTADAAFQHEALYRAIRQLPEKERAALLLFYMEDRPVKEVAAILDIPASSVRAYLTRGRQHIKAFLEKWKTSEIRKLLHETAPQPSDPTAFRLELNARLTAVEQIKTYRDREYLRTRRLLRIVFAAGLLVGVAVALLVILHPIDLPDISSITWSDVSSIPYFGYILTAAGILTAAVAIVLPLTLARRL